MVAAPKVMGNAGTTTTTSAVFKGNLPALFIPMTILLVFKNALIIKQVPHLIKQSVLYEKHL